MDIPRLSLRILLQLPIENISEGIITGGWKLEIKGWMARKGCGDRSRVQLRRNNRLSKRGHRNFGNMSSCGTSRGRTTELPSSPSCSSSKAFQGLVPPDGGSFQCYWGVIVLGCLWLLKRRVVTERALKWVRDNIFMINFVGHGLRWGRRKSAIYRYEKIWSLNGPEIACTNPRRRSDLQRWCKY